MGDIAGVVEHGIRKEVGDVVLADHDLDVDAEVVGVAEDFEDAAARLAVERGPVGDLDIDDEIFEIVLCVKRMLRILAKDAMRGGFGPGIVILVQRHLIAEGDKDGLSHALVEGDYVVALRSFAVA